jgi:cytochrome P450
MTELPVRAGELAALGALFAPGVARDPYPAYRQWRAERPLARPRERLFVLSRFADCEAVLADPAFGRDEDLGRSSRGSRRSPPGCWPGPCSPKPRDGLT